jgi:hypothetical protein
LSVTTIGVGRVGSAADECVILDDDDDDDDDDVFSPKVRGVVLVLFRVFIGGRNEPEYRKPLLDSSSSSSILIRYFSFSNTPDDKTCVEGKYPSIQSDFAIV